MIFRLIRVSEPETFLTKLSATGPNKDRDFLTRLGMFNKREVSAKSQY